MKLTRRSLLQSGAAALAAPAAHSIGGVAVSDAACAQGAEKSWRHATSLFGDVNMHGPEGVRFYTHLKTTTARWPTGIRSGAEFNFKSRA